MIVIRKDEEKDVDNGVKSGKDRRKSFLPLLYSIGLFILLFLIIPVGLIFLLRLPWSILSFYPYNLIIGVILIVSGIIVTYMGIQGLRLRYSRDSYAKNNEGLVTTGIYAYTRNPMYLGATILILGIFILLSYTFILISTILFLILFYLTAKSEEKQLEEKYGKSYRKYKSKVPLFIPYPKK